MSHDQLPRGKRMPAPCIIDTGTVVNKQDIQRVLTDLSCVHYIHTQDGVLTSEGEGYVLEVFADPQRSTLIANHALYINVCSFDYLELGKSEDNESVFNLIQDDRRLQLIPTSNPMQEQQNHRLNVAALEAVVAEVLSANWDVQIDDEEHFSF